MQARLITKVEDVLPVEMHSKVVYKIHSCCQVYIGETISQLEMIVKEHPEACRKGKTDKSAIADHTWSMQHPILWDKTADMDWRCLGVGQLLLEM